MKKNSDSLRDSPDCIGGHRFTSLVRDGYQTCLLGGGVAHPCAGVDSLFIELACLGSEVSLGASFIASQSYFYHGVDWVGFPIPR